MSSSYGPARWQKQAKQSVRIDDRTLPAAVTLANEAGAVGTLESISGAGVATDITAQVTISGITVTTGKSGVADRAVICWLEAVGDGPAAGHNYLLQIQIDRSDTGATGEQAVLETMLTISD